MAKKTAQQLSTIEEAIEEYRNGRFVIIVDDEDRENEGDLTHAGPVRRRRRDQLHGPLRPRPHLRAMTAERLDELRIPMMVGRNDSHFGTAFTVSVEARCGVTTGISAADRARHRAGARRSRQRRRKTW